MNTSSPKFRDRGQVLVVVLMIVALTATLAGTAVIRVVSDTRQTKEIEDKQKTDNAAKGIIEQVLNNENASVTSDGSLNTAVVPVNQNPLGPSEFVTKLIPKDSQYIFYNQLYDFAGNSFSGPATTANLDIYFNDTSGVCPVLELIYVSTSNLITSRKVSGSCGGNSITSGTTPAPPVPTVVPTTITFEGTSAVFNKKMSINNLSGTRLLVIRPIFASTELGFRSTAGNLPPQGEFVTATAQSAGGAQTDQKIYRPYPQIPDFFFATSF